MGQNKAVLDEIMNELLDEICLGLCFELHRSCKIGTFFLDDMDLESQKRYEIKNEKGKDVFGQLPSTKKQFDCVCPNCEHNLAASRFAPHLEKCMGMHTGGTRMTSRRGARSSNKKSSEPETDDNSEDDDWTYGSSGKRGGKKAKHDKKLVASKKSKSGKSKPDDSDAGGQTRLRGGASVRESTAGWDVPSSSPADSSSTLASGKSPKKRKHSKHTKKKRRSSAGSAASFSP